MIFFSVKLRNTSFEIFDERFRFISHKPNQKAQGYVSQLKGNIVRSKFVCYMKNMYNVNRTVLDYEKMLLIAFISILFFILNKSSNLSKFETFANYCARFTVHDN